MRPTLNPGNYFIEMAFRRMVDEETLTRALTAMGFTSIEFDKDDDAEVGAVPVKALGRVRAITPVASRAPVATSRAPVTVRPSAAASIAVVAVDKPSSTANAFLAAVSKPTLSPAVAAPPTMVMVQPAITKPTAAAAAFIAEVQKPIVTSSVDYSMGTYEPKTPAASAPAARSTSRVRPKSAAADSVVSVERKGSPNTYTAAEPADAQREAIAEAQRAIEDARAKGAAVVDATVKTKRDADAYAPKPAEANAEVPPNNYKGGDTSEDGGGAGNGEDGGAGNGSEQAAPPPAVMQPAEKYNPEEATPERVLLAQLSSEMAQAMSSSVPIPDRWKRWVEWGSPFATSAAHLTNMSGEEEEDITRFRFVATLTRALAPSNLPDMSWVFIRRLSIDPFADLSFKLTPFKLKRNGLYEFRFFSRMKANPTKESVKETLATMGFSPMKLNLLKKNMRIPFRSKVSVCMWLGIGRWSAPNSVVTTEDPFFIESLKEVQP